jgi:hypothetical protein
MNKVRPSFAGLCQPAIPEDVDSRLGGGGRSDAPSANSRRGRGICEVVGVLAGVRLHHHEAAALQIPHAPIRRDPPHGSSEW